MKLPQLIVRVRSQQARAGWLEMGPFRWPCALGRTGIGTRKREGDGATPKGRHRLVFGYYRADRFRRQPSSLPLGVLERTAGWCDAPYDANYNRKIHHPYRASAERLWRDDHLYDCIIVLDHNMRPRIRGGGSAIFLHIAGPDFAPTEGCIALRARDLRILLASLPRNAVLTVP